MRRAEILAGVNRIAKALDWQITCPLPPYPHSRVLHWTDRVGPKRYSPMLGVEEL